MKSVPNAVDSSNNVAKIKITVVGDMAAFVTSTNDMLPQLIVLPPELIA